MNLMLISAHSHVLTSIAMLGGSVTQVNLGKPMNMARIWSWTQRILEKIVVVFPT